MNERIETRYVDEYNAPDVIENAREDIETAGQYIDVTVVDAGQIVLDGVTNEELKARNLKHERDYEPLFTIRVEKVTVTLTFHETVVDNELRFMPAGVDAIDPQQATQPRELSSVIDEPLERIEDHFDIHKWDFAEVSGASIAQPGHITDFEYEYEGFIQ